MTTDLTQLHPHKDFSDDKPAKAPMVWLAAGVGALVASGFAAFGAMRPAAAPAHPTGEFAASLVEPATTEAFQAELAAFGEGSEPESAADDDADPSRAAAKPDPTPALAASPDNAMPRVQEDPASSAANLADAAPSVEPAGVGAYYVQLASYHTKERADAQAAELVARGFKAQSAAYGGPEAGWWHAVRLGPFKERFDAEKQRFDLPTHDRRSAYVLPRSNGKFHVQVASFAEEEEAEQAARGFRAQGHSTKVTRVRMSGTYWHCVRIGPFDSRDEATAYKTLVADVPGSESTVIPFGPPPATP